MEKLNEIIGKISDLVWGLPLIILILFVGILYTLRLRGLQIRKLPKALKYMLKNEEEGVGEVSSFGALCITLSATIGTGSIVGVAMAISIGGPGALFWMFVMSMLGMATKYAEGFLAIKYRKLNEDGTTTGGPYSYIEYGMGKKWKWLAITFAVLGLCAGCMGIGTSTQVTGITEAFENIFLNENTKFVNILGNNVSIIAIVVGSIITILTALVLIGGIKRIESVCTLIVPVMAVGYVLICLFLCIYNIKAIPAAFKEIFIDAFNVKAIGGGFTGTLLVVIQTGVAKGIFSNESGLGSTPIASSTAKTKDPVRQGLVLMTGTFITAIICIMTGLGIVIGKTWTNDLGYEGINITIEAFKRTLPFPDIISALVIALSITFFAFTSIVGWNVYGVRCLNYLTKNNKKAEIIYKIAWILAVFIAPYLTLTVIWKLADIFNGLMALPNLVALIALSGVVSKETRKYFIPTLATSEEEKKA